MDWDKIKNFFIGMAALAVVGAIFVAGFIGFIIVLGKVLG